MESGVYQITNILSNKKYIGSAKNINRRFYEHQYYLEKNDHVNIHLQRAWNKDGGSNFTFDVIEYCDQSILLEREQYHIDSNDTETLYNLGTVGGGDNITNHPDYDKIVAKIQAASKKMWENMSVEEYERRCKIVAGENNPNYGNKWSDEQRQLASERMKTRFAENPAIKEIVSKRLTQWWDDITPEQRKDISEQRKIRQTGEGNSFYGREHSIETKALISAARKEKIKNLSFEEYVALTKSKPISVDGVEHKSVAKASEIIGVKSATIRYRCKSSSPRWRDWFYI